MDIQQIKQRFGIIGTFPGLDRAIDIARQLNLGRMPLEGFLDTPLTIEPKS